jgi:hypothetical protein
MHPYHLQPVQGLLQKTVTHLQFCRLVLHKFVDEPYLSSRVLSTDEAGFTRSGTNHLHNLYEWALENPHATRQSPFQHRFSVNVWARVISKHLVGPYITEERIGGGKYTQLLEAPFPLLLEDAPPDIRVWMWFQYDAAPPHFTRQVRNLLDTNYSRNMDWSRGSSALASTLPKSNTRRLFFVGLS